MKRAKADSVDVPSAAISSLAKHRIGKPSAKSARKTKNFTSPGTEKRLHTVKKSRRASGIRETDEARVLLEKQLHSLYWWVFNACKMKGFIRAKELDALKRTGANRSETRPEQLDFGKPGVSPEHNHPHK
jgi:hypothetical protein